MPCLIERATAQGIRRKLLPGVKPEEIVLANRVITAMYHTASVRTDILPTVIHRKLEGERMLKDTKRETIVNGVRG